MSTYRTHETISSRRKNLENLHQWFDPQRNDEPDKPIEAWLRRQGRSRQACAGHFSVKPPAGVSMISASGLAKRPICVEVVIVVGGSREMRLFDC